MASSSMRSDDALAWIARSVLIICGGAFLVVGCQLFWRWQGYFQPLGEIQRVAGWAEGEQIDEAYWQSLVTSHWAAGAKVTGHELQQLRQQLLSTGYFEKFDWKFSGDELEIHYRVNRPLAILTSASLSPSMQPICLYEGGGLLPYLLGSCPLPAVILKLAEESKAPQADQAYLASQILEQLQGSESLNQAIERRELGACEEIDLEPWRGLNHPASELILSFARPRLSRSSSGKEALGAEAIRSRPLFLRLGCSRLCKLQWLKGPQLTQLLQWAQTQGADWIDARLEDMVILGYESGEIDSSKIDSSKIDSSKIDSSKIDSSKSELIEKRHE